jgi:hypothetical protein
VRDENSFPAKPGCDVRYTYDEWSNVRRIQATFTPTWGGETKSDECWYDYDPSGRMTVSNGALKDGTIRVKRHTPGIDH